MPIHFIRPGSDAVLRTLLNAKADVNAQNAHGNTALHNMALLGDVDAAKTLIAAGAEVDIVNIRRRTAMHMAATQRYKELVRVLVHAGADPNRNTVPMFGLPQMDIDIADMLTHEARNRIRWQNRCVWLHALAKRGY
jgi:ankyrin repeat protein